MISLLEVDEGSVESVGFLHELVVRAHLHDLAILYCNNDVRVTDGGEAVGDDDGGAANDGIVKCFLDHSLGLGV